MEKQKKKKERRAVTGPQKKETIFEHDVTVMTSEPMKVRLFVGARKNDVLDKAGAEMARRGKKLDLSKYDCMINGKVSKADENPILTRASVISLVNRHIEGGK